MKHRAATLRQQSYLFSNGVIYTAFNCVGNTPDDSDLLNSSVMNSSSTSALSEKMRWKWARGALRGKKLANSVDDAINAESAEG